jgi:hypothetical protein
MMFREIAIYLSSENGLTIVMVILLLYLVFDEKALERIKNANMKKLILLPVFAYFIQLILGIIQIIRKY